jgi:hypothetical protein
MLLILTYPTTSLTNHNLMQQSLYTLSNELVQDLFALRTFFKGSRC